jgi:hypothetical protein
MSNRTAALNLIGLLPKCKCDLCKQELEKLLKKYGLEN